MAFAGRMTVFPGGGVDQRDLETNIGWHGPPPAWWAHQWHCTVDLAKALLCAAVRETFEETGVLLAGTDAQSVVSNARRYHEQREALSSGQLTLAKFLAEAGLVMRADLLRPWANWVTPVQEPRRYDTRFFLARLPAGQEADGQTTEADHAQWQRPADTLADWRAGRCALLPPTWMTLAELAEIDTVDTALHAERTIVPIRPELVRRDGVVRAIIPDRGQHE